MSVDYSWGIGHGISVPIDDEYDYPDLTNVLSEHFDVEVDDGLCSFSGGKTWERGILVSAEGNLMGGDATAVIVDLATHKGGNCGETAGVDIMNASYPTHPEIQALHEKLTAAGVEHTAPQWLYFNTVS